MLQISQELASVLDSGNVDIDHEIIHAIDHRKPAPWDE
jgi:hypothetical protein